jgi:cytochrome b
VWDVPVRVFHWALVACVAVAWTTGGTGSRLHELAGFGIGSLILFRLLWGFAGTRHALFRDFVPAPRRLVAYLAALRANRAERHIGHNPAGGLMVVLLLACLATLVGTGLMQSSHRFFGVAWVEELHATAGHVLLGLIGVHLFGVLATSWMHQENLVRSMLNGMKAADTPQEMAETARDRQIAWRVHGSQGFSLLMFLLAGGIYFGWGYTADRAVKTAEAPEVPAAEPAVPTARPGKEARPDVPPRAAALAGTPAHAAGGETDTPRELPAATTRAQDATAGGGLNAVRLSDPSPGTAGRLSPDREQQDYVVGGPTDASMDWLL